MIFHCPRCQRVNPPAAQFCHFDGVELRTGRGGVYRGGELGREFVFPSGRRCKTFDELVRGCSEEWPAARNMLRQGGMQQFLAAIGRADLALMAQQASREADADLALDQFLSQLPARDGLRARLDLSPRRIHLGKIRVGESRQCTVTITNQGAGLLHGTLHVEDTPWLQLPQASNGEMTVKTGRTQQVSLQIDTLGLVAGQPYAGKVVAITNGGVAELPVHMELLPAPFPHSPLEGCTSPRELASRMKEFPKQVVPLLESGEVQRWFTNNGWNYPIQGAQARGVASVQQFFEGLGLSRPPPLQMSDREVVLQCRMGQTARGQLTLQTVARKWVYAHVESDSPWLVLEEPDVGGAQQALIGFRAVSRGLTGGWKYQGHLTIIANGGSKFAVPVRLECRPVRLPLGERIVRLVLVGGILGLLARLLLSLPDLWAREGASFGSLLQFLSEEGREEYIRRFVQATAWLGPILGTVLLWKRSGLRDLLPGLIVGTVTGVAASATLASLLIVLDRLTLRFLPFSGPAVAIAVWSLAGAGLVAAFGLLGRRGTGIISRLFQSLGSLLDRLGWKSLSNWMTEEA